MASSCLLSATSLSFFLRGDPTSGSSVLVVSARWSGDWDLIIGFLTGSVPEFPLTEGLGAKHHLPFFLAHRVTPTPANTIKMIRTMTTTMMVMVGPAPSSWKSGSPEARLL